MRLYVCLVILLQFMSACTLAPADKDGAAHAKGNPYCFEYSAGMDWDQVQKKFGEPPLAFLPDLGTDLSENVQGYRDVKVYFYTKPQRLTQEGGVRFSEVVCKIKICKQE